MEDAGAEAVDIVIPAHNEAESIGATLHELHDVLTVRGGIPIRLIVCEDGSTDGTPKVLQGLAEELPLVHLTSEERKGYSRAIVDGLRFAETRLVGFMDGDGQYDPADFIRLWERREEADVVIGYRAPRHDPAARKAFSLAFRALAYERLFPVRLKDPSSPFGLAHRAALAPVVAQGAGVLLPQGFWWEFYARAQAAGLSILELPVRHRVRTAGSTQVYRPTKVPRIAAVHLRGLVKLRRRLASAPPAASTSVE